MKDIEIKIKVDTSEFDAAIERMKAALAPDPAPDPAIGIIALGAAAAGSQRKIARRSLLGLIFKGRNQ
jgi:hypothetical protein